ncbi:MAG: helix-turn-helix domain-containing protein [Nitrospiraceae bacterium]
MPTRTASPSILLLTADLDLQAQFKRDFKDAAITVAKDLASLHRALAKRTFDGVIIETKRGQPQELADLSRHIDPARTVVIAGARTTLRQTHRMFHALSNGVDPSSNNHADPNFSLDDYIKSKLGEFVRGMKNGSARDLHPILIKAVEEPLIMLVLRETNGNQMQAADLLGMNRNTLRKKINEFRISVTRARASKA